MGVVDYKRRYLEPRVAQTRLAFRKFDEFIERRLQTNGYISLKRMETNLGNEFKHLVVLSTSFTVVFTAYMAIQNLQSSLNQEQGLGIISLSCLYACVIVSGISAPIILRWFGEKRVFVFSFLCHLVYTGSNFYPKFVTLIPSSLLLGLATGPLWTSQSVYVADRAFSYARRTGECAAEILTKHNGVFFTLFGTTQITGNLISSLVLQRGIYNNSTGDTTVDRCGSSDCPKDLNSTKIDEPDQTTVYTLLGIYLACDIAGLGLVAFFLPSLNRDLVERSSGVCRTTCGCWRALFDIDLVLLVPLFMFMAMEQGIIWTDFTKAFISCPVGLQYVGFVMATYGVSTTIFSLVLSRLSKFVPRYIMIASAGMVDLGTFATLYIWTPTPDDLKILFLIAIVWGIAAGIWQTYSNALVAELFETNQNAAFANYHTWKAISFTITFVCSTSLCVSTQLIIASALAVLALACYAVMEIRFIRRTTEISLERVNLISD